MKKLPIVLLILLLIGLPTSASMIHLPSVQDAQAGVVIAPISSGGSSYACFGFSTDCDSPGTPGASYSNNYRCISESWTATEGGTINAFRVYIGSTAPSLMTGHVFSDSAGEPDAELCASSEQSSISTTNGWTDWISISSGTTSFDLNDVLHPVVSLSDGGGANWSIGANYTGGSSPYYGTGYPATDSTTWTAHSAYHYGIQFRYTPD